MNGVNAPESSVTGRTNTVAYARQNGTNTIVVRAFDRAGNVSGPSNTRANTGMFLC